MSEAIQYNLDFDRLPSGKPFYRWSVRRGGETIAAGSALGQDDAVRTLLAAIGPYVEVPPHLVVPVEG